MVCCPKEQTGYEGLGSNCLFVGVYFAIRLISMLNT